MKLVGTLGILEGGGLAAGCPSRLQVGAAATSSIGSGEDSSEAGCGCPHGWICGRHAHTAEQDGCRKTGMQGEERAADMEAV